MGFGDLFLLTILLFSLLNAISGKLDHKISPFSVEVGTVLIHEFPKKVFFGRILFEDEAIAKEMTTNVISSNKDETKFESADFSKKDSEEVPQESKANEVKVDESKEIASQDEDLKNVRISNEKEIVNNGNRTDTLTKDQEGNKEVDTKSETSESSDESQGEAKHVVENGPETTNIDSVGSASDNSEIKSREMPKENQTKDEENDSAEASQERVDAVAKELAEAKTNDTQIEVVNEQQNLNLHQKVRAEREKEASVQENEETADQKEIQNATNTGNVDKTVEELEAKLVGEQEQKGAATDQDRNIRIEAENGTSENRSAQGDGSTDKLEKDSETELEQEESEIKENKTADKKPDTMLSDANPIEKLKEDADKMEQDEQENKGVNDRSENADKLEAAEGDLKEGNRMQENEEEKDLTDTRQQKEESDKEAKEAESQVEDVSIDTAVDLDVTSVPGLLSRQTKDLADEDYSDLVQEFTDLPSKFHGTAEKVAEHLAPEFLKWSDTSKTYFNIANQHIAESFSPLVGRQYAPFLASIISYALLFVPLIVVVIMFEHIRALLSLQKILLFINIYLSAYFATLTLASFAIGSEPMIFFYKSSLSSYIYLQLLQALGYLVYLILQTFNIIISCSSDTFAAKLTSALQWVVAALVGLHYYVTVFQRAMASKAPRTSWKIYGIYSIAFFVLCLFARIRRLKKHYAHAGDGMTDKKN